MKKIASLILAVVMMAALVCVSAHADEVPQPEAGKKFETNWAIFGMTVRIVYEEEGYRVGIRSWDPAELKGTEWEYSCYYVEEEDALVSVSSAKHSFTQDPETFEITDAPAEYDDLDDENTATAFRITEEGLLRWEDGRGQDGADLEFADIGNFEGVWRSEDNYIWVEIEWNDAEDDYGYFVFLHRGTDEVYAEFTAKGLYNVPEAGKLVAETFVPVATNTLKDGAYETVYDEDTYELVFSGLEDGKLLFEAENGVELYYDLMGNEG